MTLLQRYIFKELLLPFVLSFVILNFIFMGGYLVKAANLIIGRGIPLLDTLYVLGLAFPGMVGYTLPTSILMAVLLSFGGLAQNNELRAIKASGINLIQVLLPAFMMGLFLSLGILFFNDQIASNAGFELRKTLKTIVIKFPKALIEPGRFVKLSDSIIFMTKEMKDDELIDIIAYEVEKDDNPVRTIIAERGAVITDPEAGEIQIQLYNGSISDAQKEGVHTIQFKTYEFPTFGQEDIRKMQKKKKDLTLAEILIELQDKQQSEEEKRELWTAFHNRVAFACGSFIFVLIGVPFAVLARRGEVVVSFAVAMGMASGYYILFAGAKTLAVQGVLPIFMVIWAPNILLLAIGSFFLRKALSS